MNRQFFSVSRLSVLRQLCRRLTLTAVVCVALSPVALGQEPGSELIGAAIEKHPAGKALIEASRLLKAGELAQVKGMSVYDVRDEWLSLSPEDQREEAEAAQSNAPDPEAFEKDLRARGVLTFYGEMAQLSIESENSEVMAFVSLEEGVWKVTAGPRVIDTSYNDPGEPQYRGEEIVDHEIGRLLLSYVTALETDGDAATTFLTHKAQSERLALSPEELADSDRYRRSLFQGPTALEEMIRNGGSLYIETETAFFSAVSSTSEAQADGSVNYTSTSVSVPLALENGAWKIDD